MEELDEIMPVMPLVEAIHPNVFAVSLTPILLGSALAFWDGHLDVVSCISVVTLTLCGHATCNLHSFKQRMESTDHQKKDQTMLDHPLTPKQLQQVLTILNGVTALTALYVLSHQPLASLPLLAVAAAAAYTCALDPFNMRHKASGDLSLAFIGLPSAAEATYLMLTGMLSLKPLFCVLPLSAFALGLLHVRHGRFVGADSSGGIGTVTSTTDAVSRLRRRSSNESLAQIVGGQHSTEFLQLLLYTPHALLFVFAYLLTFWLLLPLCTIPLCHKIIQEFKAGNHKALPHRTALAMLLFGVLFALAIFLASMRALYIVGLVAFLGLCIVVFFLSNDLGNLFQA